MSTPIEPTSPSDPDNDGATGRHSSPSDNKPLSDGPDTDDVAHSDDTPGTAGMHHSDSDLGTGPDANTDAGTEPSAGYAGLQQPQQEAQYSEKHGKSSALPWIIAALSLLALLAIGGYLAVTSIMENSKESAMQESIDGLLASDTFEEFNGALCEQNRSSQETIDEIEAEVSSSGGSIDEAFKADILGNLPERMTVIDVINPDDNDGTEAAVVKVESNENSSLNALSFTKDGDRWLLCDNNLDISRR